MWARRGDPVIHERAGGRDVLSRGARYVCSTHPVPSAFVLARWVDFCHHARRRCRSAPTPGILRAALRATPLESGRSEHMVALTVMGRVQPYTVPWCQVDGSAANLRAKSPRTGCAEVKDL